MEMNGYLHTSGPFTPHGKTPGMHLAGDRVGPRTDLGTWEKNVLPLPEIEWFLGYLAPSQGTILTELCQLLRKVSPVWWFWHICSLLLKCLKNHESIGHKICISFFLQHLCETVFTLINMQWIMLKRLADMCVSLYVRCSLLSDFNQNWKVLTHFSESLIY